jgi:hypothetical protein
MAEPKTRPGDADVNAFLDGVADERRREDARAVCAMMKKITRREPVLWGTSIIGFGSYTYGYASGRSGDWPLTGVSPRKQALTVYVMSGFDEYGTLLEALGPHKTGRSCLYIRDLAKVDQTVLARLIRKSVAHLRRKWPTR